MRKLFLLDGHALCYRAFYAIKSLSNSHGQPTNAVYGFVSTLRKLIQEFDPEYMVVCFDSKDQTLRQEKYEAYKIQRPSMPVDLVSQIPIIKNILEAYQIMHIATSGYEADDLIGTFAKKYQSDFAITIVSDDKDLFQLANENVCFYSPRKQRILTRDDLEDLLGFSPCLMADFIGLAGDSSDNIPGVRGVGKKTALKLLNEFGSLEELLNRIEQVEPERIRKKIIDARSDALMSKDLALLVKDMDLDVKAEDFKIGEPKRSELFTLFKIVEFHRLAHEYTVAMEEKPDVAVFEVKDEKDQTQIINQIKTARQLLVLTEPQIGSTTFWLSVKSSEVWSWQTSDATLLRKALSESKAQIVLYDFKQCLHDFPFWTELDAQRFFDVLLAAYVLNPSERQWDLNHLIWVHCQQSVLDSTPMSELMALTWLLFDKLAAEMKDKDQSDLFYKLEMPLAKILYQVESNGVFLDRKELARLSNECETTIHILTDELTQMAGREFNLNSPKQLSQILFEELQLPVIKKTKTGFSTDESVLLILAEQHDFPQKILNYRHLAKLKSTYLDALPKLIDENTDRIHTQFLQMGTETGRLSSRHPNLQNIPIRTELGRQIRKAFAISDPQYIMVSMDYSQIELRVLAHLSNDERLIHAFRDGQDIHSYTASLIFDVPETGVTSDMRYASKRVNFGIIYGISSYGLSKDLKCSPKEAQEFINKYLQRYASVKKFMEDRIEDCRTNGYVETILKRRRYITDIDHANVNVRQFAERQAINTPVQGSAADLIKLAMIRVQKMIEECFTKARMILSVHDELLFECHQDDLETFIPAVKTEMEQAIELQVPICVTVKSGQNWLDMQAEL